MEPIEVHARLDLPPEPTSARAARQFIGEFCKAAGVGADVCDTAALLTSELVTNAILHGRTRAILHVELPGAGLRVSVIDHNPTLPPAEAGTPEMASEHGRGLLLVSMLATHWGVEQTAAGKAVWFELSLDGAEPRG